MKWYQGEPVQDDPGTGMTAADRRDVRQWEYEQGERRLPDAPRSIGNYSAAGLIWRVGKRKRDRLEAARQRMTEEQQS